MSSKVPWNSGNLAIIRLSIDQFEELRENELIYADRTELFEMRGNCIHSCGWPPSRTNHGNHNQWFIDNYGSLAPHISTILEQSPHGVEYWIQSVPDKIKSYRDSISGASSGNAARRRPVRHNNQTLSHPQLKAMLQETKRKMTAARKSAEKLPTSTFECAMLLINGDFPTPPSEAQFNEHTYSNGPIYEDLAKKSAWNSMKFENGSSILRATTLRFRDKISLTRVLPALVNFTQ